MASLCESSYDLNSAEIEASITRFSDDGALACSLVEAV